MSFKHTIIALSTIAFSFLLPPLAWHLKSQNVPAVVLIIWLLLMNLQSVVNAVLWGTLKDLGTGWDGKIWCDIMIKISVGANVGISCAVANIGHNLYQILKADSVLPETGSPKKIMTDLVFCLATPIMVMILSYMVQQLRYGLVLYSGCQPLLSPTWVSIVCYSLWMLVWSLIGFIYALLLLYVFFRKRKDVGDILRCTNSGLNITRFARLLIFCFMIILIMFPVSIYSFVVDLEQIGSGFNFKKAHDKERWKLIPRLPVSSPLFFTWLYIAMSYCVFLIFGLGSDAVLMYIEWLRYCGFSPVINRIQRWYEAKKYQEYRNMSDRYLPSGEDKPTGQVIGRFAATDYNPFKTPDSARFGPGFDVSPTMNKRLLVTLRDPEHYLANPQAKDGTIFNV